MTACIRLLYCFAARKVLLRSQETRRESGHGLLINTGLLVADHQCGFVGRPLDDLHHFRFSTRVCLTSSSSSITPENERMLQKIRHLKKKTLGQRPKVRVPSLICCVAQDPSGHCRGPCALGRSRMTEMALVSRMRLAKGPMTRMQMQGQVPSHAYLRRRNVHIKHQTHQTELLPAHHYLATTDNNETRICHFISPQQLF